MKHENCTVELSSNRLILSKDCVTLLNITAGERLSIMYYQIDNQTTIPLIGKSSCFTDENDGNFYHYQFFEVLCTLLKHHHKKPSKQRNTSPDYLCFRIYL